MEAEEVGGAGFGAGSGYDAEDLALLDKAEIFEHLFGHVYEFVGRVEAFAEDRVGAPEEHAAVNDLGKRRERVDGWVGVVLGEQAGGGAGLGEDGDGAKVEVVGGVGHALADGFGDGKMGGVGDDLGGMRVGADLMLGLGDDLGHHGDGFDGVLAGSGLAGEHDGVGAVVDCVGDVRGLGAGGPWVLDHGLEHLGGGDDGFAELGGAADDVLLHGRDFFGRDLDAEIAAGDHDGVGGFKDAVEMLDGLGLFELGDDPGVRLEGGEAVLDVADIIRCANEGDGDGVDALADGEYEVLLVLVGERGDFDGDAGEVDALVLAERAAVDNLADYVLAFDHVDAQLDEAVGEEDAGTMLQVFCEGLEDGADHGGGAFDLTRGDDKALACDELDGLVVLELAGANLGALEVGEDADGLALFAGDGADHLDEFSLLGVGAVREVEAGDIEASANEGAEEIGRAAGGTECGDYLGATATVELRRRGLRQGIVRAERGGVHKGEPMSL